MKKLQFLALSMLLSTNYIMHASTNNSNTMPPQNGDQQTNQWKKGNHKKSDFQQNMQANVNTALGGSITFASLASYANQLSSAIANLSASSSPDDFEKVKKMYLTIGSALKQLAPQSASNQKDRKDRASNVRDRIKDRRSNQSNNNDRDMGYQGHNEQVSVNSNSN